MFCVIEMGLVKIHFLCLKTNMTSKRQHKENNLKLKYKALLEKEKRKEDLRCLTFHQRLFLRGKRKN